MESIACYVLGLRDGFRGEALMEQLQNLDLPAEIFFGINAVENQSFLSEKVDQKASNLLQGRNMGRGEVACALGHIGIWEKFLETGKKWAFVFEDDSLINEDIGKVLATVSTFQNPTIVQLHCSNPAFKTVFLRRKVLIHGLRSDSEQDYLHRKLDFSIGGYAYLLNRAAAEIAVRESNARKIIDCVDWPYLWRHKVEFWEPSLNIARHQGESLIGKERAELVRDLRERSESSLGRFNRMRVFAFNLLGIPAWRFHRLGYPGRIIYFNNVVMPVKRKLILLGHRVLRAFSSRKGQT